MIDIEAIRNRASQNENCDIPAALASAVKIQTSSYSLDETIRAMKDANLEATQLYRWLNSLHSARIALENARIALAKWNGI